MSRIIFLKLCLIASFLFFTPIASAEIIELNNGQTIEAEILGFSDDGVKIQTENETRTIPDADISKINGRSLNADLTIIPALIPREEARHSAASTKTKNLNQINDIVEKFKKNLNKIFHPPPFKNGKSIFFVIPAFLASLLVLSIVMWFPFFIIARKLGLSPFWQFLVFVPLIQVFGFLKIAGRPWWWIFILLIPIVNIIFIVVLSCDISRRCGKDKLLGILVMIPLANMILLWYLALSMQETVPESTPSMPAPEKKRYSITPFEDESKSP